MNANLIIQIMGVLYFLIGLAFLFNKKHYKTIFKDVLKSNLFMFFWWLFWFVLGLIILYFYYEITFTREWLITFVWFASLFKWLSWLLFPKQFKILVKLFSKPKYFDLITFFILVIGILLIYLGFIWG